MLPQLIVGVDLPQKVIAELLWWIIMVMMMMMVVMTMMMTIMKV